MKDNQHQDNPVSFIETILPAFDAQYLSLLYFVWAYQRVSQCICHKVSEVVTEVCMVG